MSDMLTDDIYAIAEQFDVPMPKPVMEARALVKAVESLRDSIATETEPDLADVTLKRLNSVHAALVDWQNREARLSAADAILKAAHSRLDEVKFQNAATLEAPLAGLFNDAAERFTTAHRDLAGNLDQVAALRDPSTSDAWRQLSNAANELDQLARARDAFSPVNNRADIGDQVLERATRTAVVPSKDALRFVGRRRGLEGWAEQVGHGFRLVWQSRHAQQLNADHVRELARAER